MALNGMRLAGSGGRALTQSKRHAGFPSMVQLRLRLQGGAETEVRGTALTRTSLR